LIYKKHISTSTSIAVFTKVPTSARIIQESAIVQTLAVLKSQTIMFVFQ